ncbi:MAG TPA: dephospho-CoA kinase [Candidatus Ratteibacteria bacterium]|nr:dephospho-CoA kinase [bacterium]HRR96359.1 dephospho-CoA kinase [Candidatus Ratteibacteria bacterium]
MEKIKRVGVTGIFGSGKSTVTSIFKKYGIEVISCDEIVHFLLEKENIKKKLIKIFGKEIVKDGKIDRKKISDIIFKNKLKKKELENLIHPLVFKEIDKKIKRDIDKIKKKGIIIVEIPLLFETKSEKKFDFILVVSASPEIIKERLKEKFSSKEVELRWRNQIPLIYKEKNANFVIDNSGTISQTEKIVKEIIKKIISQ